MPVVTAVVPRRASERNLPARGQTANLTETSAVNSGLQTTPTPCGRDTLPADGTLSPLAFRLLTGPDLEPLSLLLPVPIPTCTGG